LPSAEAPETNLRALPPSSEAKTCSVKFEMTMRYAHLSPDVRKDAVRLLDAAPPDNRLTTASFSNVSS
jgi:hypothetical protein